MYCHSRCVVHCCTVAQAHYGHCCTNSDNLYRSTVPPLEIQDERDEQFEEASRATFGIPACVPCVYAIPSYLFTGPGTQPGHPRPKSACVCVFPALHVYSYHSVTCVCSWWYGLKPVRTLCSAAYPACLSEHSLPCYTSQGALSGRVCRWVHKVYYKFCGRRAKRPTPRRRTALAVSARRKQGAPLTPPIAPPRR